MSQKNTSLKSLLKRAELLESRTVLSGAAIVQPFASLTSTDGESLDWSLKAIDAQDVWDQGFTGEDIVVAVIDTGVDLFHEDLVHSIWVNEGEIPGNDIDDDNNGFVDDVHGWDFVDYDNDAFDLSGHGTAVAGGVVAARNNTGATGVAYDASLMVVRVLDADGRGTQLDIAAGIRYAIANGADIINLSLGGNDSKRIETAIQYARTEDVLVVAASGNAGAGQPDFPAQYSGEFNNVISVGAIDSNFELSEFSNIVGDTNSIQVDAPGQSIYSTVPADGYQYVSGTSFAAPHVAGVAALALSANPDLSAGELRDLITQGAQVDATYSDSVGILNAATTVALVTASVPQVDVPDAGEPLAETDEQQEEVAESLPEVNDDSADVEQDELKESTEPNEPTSVGDNSDTTSDADSEADADADADLEKQREEAASLLSYLGDIDGDGEVGFNDFLTFSRNYAAEVDPGSTGDLNRDGVVGFDDFLTLTRNFGRTLDEMFAEEEADMLSESVAEELFDEE